MSSLFIQNHYLNFVRNHSSTWFYNISEDLYRDKVLRLIPVEKFQEEYSKIDTLTKQKIDWKDFQAIRLMEYFHDELFEWMREFDCLICGQRCDEMKMVSPNVDESKWICSRVEQYSCRTCNCFYRFPRYNHPGKLLDTRKGRCGEWAIAFAYMCRVLRYNVRLVYCTSDHVWCEVWSEQQHRWIHMDPCENCHDNPLLYEAGWQKRIDIVVAYGKHEVRDVTWRYTARWRNTHLDRQRKFQQTLMDDCLEQINCRLQANLTSEERLELDKRWLSELTEFLRTPAQEVIEPDLKALQQRQSGSALVKPVCRQFRFELEPKDSIEKLDITFDCKENRYRAMVTDLKNSTSELLSLDSWSEGCFNFDNITRKVESDWRMCYLSRNESASPDSVGRITWAFCIKWPHWQTMKITLNGQTFESGSVELHYKHSEDIEFQLNQPFLVSNPDDGDKFEFQISAILKGGNGSNGWQHAQLFRQSTAKNSKPIASFVISLRKTNQ